MAPRPTRSTRHFARVQNAVASREGQHVSSALNRLPIPVHESDYGSDFDLIDVASNYGSEFDTDDEAALEDLLAQLNSDRPLVLESLYVENESTASGFVHVPRSQPEGETDGRRDEKWDGVVVQKEDGRTEVEERRNGAEEAREATASTVRIAEASDANPRNKEQVKVESVLDSAVENPEIEQAEAQPDTRSPLERFRTAPKKPLSVTDIVSPAWCELQYWYTLTKHGKKKRTPAMKQGSRVHRDLEEQVHQIVPVQVQTREDGWGLKIWNVIQGLRSLRAMGITRELEVWGVIDGQVINGVIDELSFQPAWLKEGGDKLRKSQSDPQQDQMVLDAFFAATQSQEKGKPRPRIPAKKQEVYITDVKTRSSSALPKGSSLSPTSYQLMLYHRLLTSISSNTVVADTVFTRYNLDSKAPFSDAFIAQIGGLDFTDSDTITELLDHNSLLALWDLMIQEYSLSIDTSSISSTLTAEFRSQSNGALLGRKHFEMDDARMEEYMTSEMRWWKGEREARGVEIEDSFKCRICEFADDCSWRKRKMEESMKRYQARKRESSTNM